MMLTVQDYAWLSTVVYRRTDDNQLSVANREGWEELKYISDRKADAEYSGDASGHFSAGVYQKGTDVVISFAETNTPNGGLV